MSLSVILMAVCLVQMVASEAVKPPPSHFKVFGEEVVTVRTTGSVDELEMPSRAPPQSLPLDDVAERRVAFQAFNKTYNLTLRPSPGLLSPDFGVVVRRGDNVTENRQRPIVSDDELSRCFYRGVDAAFDLCKGLRGIVSLSANEFLSVSPVRRKERSVDGPNAERHLVRRISWKPPVDLTSQFASVSHKRRRRRRQSSARRYHGITIETAVFVDAYLYSHMTRTHFPGDDAENEMTHFVLAMINAVQLLYQDESLGREITFQVQRLEMWSRQPQELQPALTGSPGNQQGIHDIDRYLNRFCQWQSRENPVGDQDSDHWDHALLLTGLDLFAVGRDGVTSHQIVGLAPIGGMCTATSSCTVNEGRHFEAVYVVAHEIGHNLGMKHDGRDAGNDCDPGSYLMSPTLGSGKTQWSPCSQHYLNSFLNTVQASCLTDRSWIPDRMDHNSSGTLPGERFTADEQCMLRYGRDSRRAPHRSLNEICRDLRCTDHARAVRQTVGSSGISFTSHPALEGTSCGEGMWCRRGRCTPRVRFQHFDQESTVPTQSVGTSFEPYPYQDEIEPPWTTVTPCASGCLYGPDYTLNSGSMAVTLQIQSCGGSSQCANVPVRYLTCDGSEVCSWVNRTTIQQYSDDICYQASQHDDSILPRGVQQLSADAFRSCQVWCYLKSGGLMTAAGWNFPDGTRCQSASADRSFNNRLDGGGTAVASLCLSGRCQEFTCDGRSSHQLHAEACRPEVLSVESNIIHDAPYAQPMKTSYKFSGDHFHYRHHHRQPIRAVHHQQQQHQQPQQQPQQQQQQPFYSPSTYPARLAMLNEPMMMTSNHNVTAGGGWGPWKSVSSCRSGCLTSSKGLRLVQRTCDRTGVCGSGAARSVQLCTPNQQECPNQQSVSAFADRVCKEQHWADHYRGMWTAAGQEENSCVVQCLDPQTNQAIPAEGDNGWFPSGTLCNHRTSSYCLSGRCVEFDAEGIPLQ